MSWEEKNSNPGTVSDKDTAGSLRSQVIDRLYEVAMDPMRYEELLDHWESMIAPIRSQAISRPIEGRLNPEFAAHFDRASKFLDRIGQQDDGNDKPGLLAQYEKVAAFLTDREMTFLDTNRAAERTLGIHRGDPLAELPLEPEDLPVLHERLQQMLAGNADISCFFRARAADSGRIMIFQLRSLHPKNGKPIVIAAVSELAWPKGFEETLQSAFGLTPAEIGILRGLTECLNLREIAAARGRSVETVRAQLRSILSKTETRSQTELVRLAMSMMDITTHTEREAARARPLSKGFARLTPRRFHQLNLPDGRRMEYLLLGDPKGRPCLFMPLDYGLVRWPASAENAAARRGIRVIVPVRAGYGNATPLPAGAHLGRTIAQDIDFLLETLNVTRCPVISLGSDIYYLCHLNQLNGNRMSAIIACAGTFPLTRPQQYERMGKWHRFILASARYTPHLLPFMVKAGFSLARRLGKRGFINAVYGNSPADVATFEKPEVFEAMVCGSEVCLSETHSAHNAFAREVIEQETTDWWPLFSALEGSLPVHYISGLQDPQVPKETLFEFRRICPWVTFHIHEDAGQLIFFLKWHEALELAEEHLV